MGSNGRYVTTLTDHNRTWCKDLGIRRSKSMNHKETKNSFQLISTKFPWWKHYIGVLGEKVWGRFTGWPVDDKTLGKGDGGYDFPDRSNANLKDSIETYG